MDEQAILTPVPIVHLESGLEVCARAGKVAFGTRAYEFFEGSDYSRHPSPPTSDGIASRALVMPAMG